MAIKQLSLYVENKKGALADVLAILSDSGVNLKAMTIADTKDFGILRIIVDDREKAEAALKAEGLVYSVTDVIAAEADDRPGGLAEVLRILMNAGIDIEYTYAFVINSGDHACAILRVSDAAAGERVLEKAGVPLVSESEIVRI